MHVDEQLVALTTETKARLAGMKDARPSEVMRVKEEFSDRWIGIMVSALGNITPEEKIAAFDQIAEEVVEHAATPEKYAGDEEGDYEHFLYETAMQAVLGKRIFDALNEVERLATRRDREEI